MLPRPAAAVPSFARQTGLACEACHTIFPELTPFGRRFKLNGYLLTTKGQISAASPTNQTTLSLADLPPLSVMVQASSTWLGKPTTDSALPQVARSQNGDVQFPQALSLFYGGKIADNFGALLQLTYTPSDNFIGIDNSDMRFSFHTADSQFVYGIDLNNNPTVQDVWNSTPAWGYPYIAPPSVPTPAAAPLISSLGQQSAGLSAYVFWSDSLYAEIGGYRSAKTGTTLPLDSTSGSVIDNIAPYWRLAYEYQWGHNAIEVGTFGMRTRLAAGGSAAAPVAISPDSPDIYTDMALDTQYQWITDDHIVTAQASWIHEHEDWRGRLAAGTVSNSSDHIDSLRLTASYYYQRWLGGSVSFNRITGTSDALLYAPANTTGSATGSPNTQSETIEVDYLPWLNTRLFAQYTVYQTFNGSSNAYDGVSGRTAADNNTLFVGLWTSF